MKFTRIAIAAALMAATVSPVFAAPAGLMVPTRHEQRKLFVARELIAQTGQIVTPAAFNPAAPPSAVVTAPIVTSQQAEASFLLQKLYDGELLPGQIDQAMRR